MFIRTIVLLLATLFYSYSAFADMNFVNQPEVKSFIHEMIKKYKFKEPELIALFNAVKIRPKVIQKVKAPFEQQPWHTYQALFITELRIRQGIEFWNKHAEVLAQVEKKYGVPASIIVATIGVETKYGRHTGEFPVIDALVNIAFSDSPRSPFFRSELKEFLLLTREQHLNPLTVMGSYAGAIGQPQFMPSSYRHYAVSLSGNSQIDLSNNISDIIASVANYYKKHGWKTNEPITMSASVSGSGYHQLSSRKHSFSAAELSQYGVTPIKAIPENQKIKLLELQNRRGSEYWLSFHNFDVIKRYNPSNLYAMAVYQLSYYLDESRGRATWRRLNRV